MDKFKKKLFHILNKLIVAKKIILRRLFIKKNILVYVGLHRGDSFNSIFLDYGTCYGFEANPSLFEELQTKYAKFPHVKLFNVAAATYDGEVTFHISNNDGVSSSIGEFKENWPNAAAGQVKMTEKIKVPCINLYNFFDKENIEHVDDYISDIQGMDLEVLRTLRPYINKRKIGSITCEVTKNEKKNVYKLPDNSEAGFHTLLQENYTLVAKGWGVLNDNQFGDIPDGSWEMDCKWRVKDT